MRVIAEHTQATHRLPTASEIDDLLTQDFFLPFANKAAHKQMRAAARRLVGTYMDKYALDLLRTWATERPFELYLPGVVVSGRADVVYDEHDGMPANLAIVDYKTATGGGIEPLQLQVYADAGRREGLTVAAAYIHDMSTATRHPVPIDDATVEAAETAVLQSAEQLTQRDFAPRPEVRKCRACDVRKMCGAALVR
jgi:DNA helicase-2/ATP-dependent DNA helicase PcrA